MKLFFAALLLASTNSCTAFHMIMSSYSAGGQPPSKQRRQYNNKRRRGPNNSRRHKRSNRHQDDFREKEKSAERKKWILERQIAAKELKEKIFNLASSTERGFECKSDQREEMNELINQLSLLNPTSEPAWSYYGSLSRQLHLSMNDKRDDSGTEDPSLEGKWTLVYTDVPEITSLSLDPLMGLAKLGRIGQECTPFPNYTVKNVIELKRPEWAKDLPFLGTAESGILQKMTMRAKASPRNPGNLGLSYFPQGVEVSSSKSTAGNILPKFSLVTDGGLVALNPLQPLKVGLQIAGFDDSKSFKSFSPVKFDDESNESSKSDHRRAGNRLNLVTEEGLVALNPFQPWKVGLQLAGFDSSAADPWKSDDESKNNEKREKSIFDFAKSISEKGFLAGLLSMNPIQLGDTEGNTATEPSQSSESGGNMEQILYLDDDIRVSKDSQNHVTIDSRTCANANEECWF